MHDAAATVDKAASSEVDGDAPMTGTASCSPGPSPAAGIRVSVTCVVMVRPNVVGGGINEGGTTGGHAGAGSRSSVGGD